MRLVRKAALHLREGTSDKVYEVDLVENDAVADPARYLVNTRYGRRGSALREGTKTAHAVFAEVAQKIFDSVVNSARSIEQLPPVVQRWDEGGRAASHDAPADGVRTFLGGFPAEASGPQGRVAHALIGSPKRGCLHALKP